jgi:hypothetical protein
MSFVVSGDAASSCNPIYFTTLDSCLKALPEVINYPILIEVASFGNLGTLQLSNKVFGPNGSLEIVNRNCGFAGAVDLSNQPMSLDEIDAGFANYSLASSVSSFASVSAPSPVNDVYLSYLYSTGQFIASGAAGYQYKDLRYSLEKQYVFTRRVARDQLGVMTASLSSTVSGWDNTGGGDTANAMLKFDRYDSLYRSQDEMDVYDASTLNELDETVIYPPTNLTDGSTGNQAVAASVYYNHLDSIKVFNCNGPIYLRNFTVDGQHTREYGIEVRNSTVNLERCSASRCTKSGLHAINSDVKLLRGFVAYRNYAFEDGNRVGIPYAQKRVEYTDTQQNVYAAGIYAENSTINFKNTYDRDVEKSSEASSLVYTATRMGTIDLPVPSQENLYCLSRNDVGILAKNSTILGGRTEVGGSATNAWQDAVQIFSELNTEAGARFYNCDVTNFGRFSLYGNYYGLDAIQSTLSFDFFKAYANQKDAIKLDGCSFKYNNNTYAGFLHGDYTTESTSYYQHQVTLLHNGTAINAKNSNIGPVFTSAMPDIYESFLVSGTHGIYGKGINGNDNNNIKPNILLNSSELDMVHAAIHPPEANVGACLGQAISAKNGSYVYLRGSGQYANKIIGSTSDDSQHNLAGVYATNNSNIYVQGPTVIAHYGIDALVDNNSTIDFCPHSDSEGNLLVSAFTLSNPVNHTMVELHATRSCLIADNGSVINMRDLGYYKNLWNNADGTYGPAISFESLDYLNDLTNSEEAAYASAVSGGFMQLYPNAFLNNSNIPFVPYTGNDPAFSTGSTTWQPYYYLSSLPTDPDQKLGVGAAGVSAITTGGMCVRALGKSNVNVLNTHFPTGHNQMSSIIYDFDGIDGLPPNCTRPPIWNIADDSILRASYLSVSGKHPNDSGYIGPSGNWYGVSEAPSSTPDTSSLSVLDYYGSQDSNQNRFGNTIASNRGPFRLYFSVDPIVNVLVDYLDTDLSGYIPQVFSQGYNFSGPAFTNFVGDYKKGYFIRESDGATSDAGFFYASAIVHSPKTTKAVLDDSAMNSFANAKHNTVNKSGLANVVSRYVTNFNIRKLN